MENKDIDVVYQMLRDFRKTLVDAGVSNFVINEYTLFITRLTNTITEMNRG